MCREGRAEERQTGNFATDEERRHEDEKSVESDAERGNGSSGRNGDFPASAVVYAQTDPAGAGSSGIVNVASSAYGSVPFSEYTNSGDQLSSVNDGIISAREGGQYDAGPRNRWTNYNKKGPAYVGVEFEGTQEVGRAKWYAFYDDVGVRKPSQVTVQYWDSESQAWHDAEVTSSSESLFENEYTTGCFNKNARITCYDISFKPVTTEKLRVALVNEAASVGGSELEVFGTYRMQHGFRLTLSEIQDGMLPVRIETESSPNARTLYLEMKDQSGCTVHRTVEIAANTTETLCELSLEGFAEGVITIRASLDSTYANSKTFTITKRIPDEVIQEIYNEVKTPYPYDIVLSFSGQKGDFDSELVDNPNVFTIPGDTEYVYMTYVGHDGTGYRTGLARSRDMLRWEKMGVVLDNGEPGAWDEYNAAGYIVRNHSWGDLPSPHVTSDGRYAMTYLASNEPGYEAGIKKAGVAFSDKILNEDGIPASWVRCENPVLDATDGLYPYEKGIIWKLQAIWDQQTQKYYGFYNAATGPEVMCGAVSDDLKNWTRMETNPLLNTETSPSGDIWGASHNADADVVKIGEYWVMFYFTSSPGGIIDSFAVSKDLQHWQKSFLPLTQRNDTWSSTYAHKPCVVKKNGVVYHYYNAVGSEGRAIAVDTSVDLSVMKTASALMQGGLSDSRKADLKAAMDALRDEMRKENGSLAGVESARRELLRVVDAVQNGHDIQLAAMENGTVQPSAPYAAGGEMVQLAVRPQQGYVLKEGSMKVTAESGAQLVVNKEADGYSFVMPHEAVTVSAVFEKKPVPTASPAPTAKPAVSPAPTTPPEGDKAPGGPVLPATGDTMLVTGMALLMAAAGAGAWILVKKRGRSANHPDRAGSDISS